MFDFAVDKHLFAVYNTNIEQVFAQNKRSNMRILVYNLFPDTF